MHAIDDKLNVPFDVLLEKLNLETYRDLKTLLKANRLPIIPNQRPIPYSTANKILQRLRGFQLSRKDLRKSGSSAED